LLSPKLFKALGDSRRLSLLLRLAGASGPCTVSDIAGGSGVDLSVVSRHLAVLRDAGVIRCVKRGKEVWCSLEPSAVVRLLRGLADELERCCPAGVCASEPASPGPSSSPRPAPSRRSR
jgi:ArsR family transcriptional regulator